MDSPSDSDFLVDTLRPARDLKSRLHRSMLLGARNNNSELPYWRKMILTAAKTGNATAMLDDLLQQGMPRHLARGLVGFLSAIPVGCTEDCFFHPGDLEGVVAIANEGITLINWFTDIVDVEMRARILTMAIADFCENLQEQTTSNGMRVLKNFYGPYLSPLANQGVSAEPLISMREWQARKLNAARPVQSVRQAQVVSLQPYLDQSRQDMERVLSGKDAEVIPLHGYGKETVLRHYINDIDLDDLPDIDTLERFLDLCLRIVNMGADAELFTAVLWWKGMETRHLMKFLKFLQVVPVTQKGVFTIKDALYYCDNYYFEPTPTINIFTDVPHIMQDGLIAVLAAHWYVKTYGDNSVRDNRD